MPLKMNEATNINEEISIPRRGNSVDVTDWKVEEFGLWLHVRQMILQHSIVKL
jgi:hypothetical protein